MLALISLILVIVGCINWLSIGLLQFDFVAGLFGSQSSIFSRIVYVIIGVGAVLLTVNIIKNKGKLGFNFKKFSFKKLKDGNKEDALAPTQVETTKIEPEQTKVTTTTNYSAEPVKAESGEDMARKNDFKSISQNLSNKHQQNNQKK